jgi:hypothetical protein
MARVQKAYVVQRLDWQYNDNWWDINELEPVKAFTDRERAERFRLELELEKRGDCTFSPAFYAGGLRRASSRSEAELRRELEAMCLPLPPLDQDHELDWSDGDWWRAVLALVADPSAPAYYARLTGKKLSPAMYERALAVSPDQLWALFDRLRFYELVEIELERP